MAIALPDNNIQPVSDSQEELACKEIIDHLHTDNPTWGARQMSAQLKARGYHVGRRKGEATQHRHAQFFPNDDEKIGKLDLPEGEPADDGH